MIHFNQLVLPEDQAKRIQAWMQHPGAADFIAWLADRAAYHAARSGNAMVEDFQAHEVDAKNEAEQAKIYLNFHALMMKVMSSDQKFELAELRPVPLTTSV